jgi:hypothetical protein
MRISGCTEFMVRLSSRSWTEGGGEVERFMKRENFKFKGAVKISERWGALYPPGTFWTIEVQKGPRNSDFG